MANIVIYDVNTKEVKDIIYSAHTPDYINRADAIVLTKEAILPEANPGYMKVDAKGAIIAKTLTEKSAYDASKVSPPRTDVDAELAALKARIELLESKTAVK